MDGERHALAALPPGKTRYPLNRGLGLDRCGKTRLHRDSIHGPSSPQRVAIPTELSRPTIYMCIWEWAVNTLHRPLNCQEIAPISNVEEARWASRPVWTGMERRKSSVPTGVRTPNRPAHRDFEPQCGAEDFYFSTPVPDRSWGPPSLMHIRYGGGGLSWG